MKPFLSTLFAVALLHLATPVHASESVVDFGSFALTLPDGYTDNPGRGIDSRVGEITFKGKPFKLHYDDYGWRQGAPAVTKLSEFHKDMLDSLIYFERIQDDPVSTCIRAWFHSNDPARRYPIVTLDVLAVGASFSIQLNSKADVKDAIEVLRAIKVTKPKASKP